MSPAPDRHVRVERAGPDQVQVSFSLSLDEVEHLRAELGSHLAPVTVRQIVEGLSAACRGHVARAHCRVPWCGCDCHKAGAA